MDNKDSGGRAFPVLCNIKDGSDWIARDGMTLRDWFAGQALPQAVEDYGTPGIRGRANHGKRITPYSAEAVGTREQIIARQAYIYADAMIEARK
jgi:hypothetical protein